MIPYQLSLTAEVILQSNMILSSNMFLLHPISVCTTKHGALYVFFPLYLILLFSLFSPIPSFPLTFFGFCLILPFSPFVPLPKVTWCLSNSKSVLFSSLRDNFFFQVYDRKMATLQKDGTHQSILIIFNRLVIISFLTTGITKILYNDNHHYLA